jgi:hypothetical protein
MLRYTVPHFTLRSFSQPCCRIRPLKYQQAGLAQLSVISELNGLRFTLSYCHIPVVTSYLLYMMWGECDMWGECVSVGCILRRGVYVTLWGVCDVVSV